MPDGTGWLPGGQWPREGLPKPPHAEDPSLPCRIRLCSRLQKVGSTGSLCALVETCGKIPSTRNIATLGRDAMPGLNFFSYYAQCWRATMKRPVQRAEINRAADLCRLALARGPLIRDGNQWRFGRRCFSNATVRRLIDDGSAARFGNVVRQTVPLSQLTTEDGRGAMVRRPVPSAGQGQGRAAEG
jgi:hypothetical protein